MLQYAGHVLLVEDNSTNRMLLETMLTQRGLGVTVAVNGEQAVRAVMNVQFDLVLMDLQMPVMGGYQATARIRQWDQAHHLARSRIAAMSADSAPEDRQRCVAADMDDFLAKPISVDELNRVLTDWLGPGSSCGDGAPDASAAHAMVFDQEGMLQRLGGDRALAAQVIQSVTESLPGYLECLELALTAGDHPAAMRVLHKMTGAVAQIGATELVLAIQQISGDLQRVAMLELAALQPLRQDYYRLMERLAQWR